MLTIELPTELEARLEALASEHGQSAGALVREAVLKLLDDLEDIAAAEAALAEIEAGHGQPVPLEDVVKAFGLED